MGSRFPETDTAKLLAKLTLEKKVSLPPTVPVLSAEYLDWLSTNVDSSEDAFQNFAWMFSDESLNDLYSMSFLDPTSMGMGDMYQPQII